MAKASRAVGAAMAVSAVRAAIAGNFGQAGIFLIPTLMFGGVGFGMLTLAVKGMKQQ